MLIYVEQQTIRKGDFQMTTQTKKLDIEFLYLDLNTCERCKATDTYLHDALAVLSGVFYTLGYSANITKVDIQTSEQAEQYHFFTSPTIRVNSVDIFGEIKENDCKDCGDLCGGSVDCRIFAYEGKDYEQPPTAMIVDGILRVLYGNATSEDKPYVMPDNLNNYFSKKNAIIPSSCGCSDSKCC